MSCWGVVQGVQAAGSAGSRSDNQHHSPQQLSKQRIKPWPLLPTCCDRCLLVIDINNQTETATWWNNLWLQTDALDIKRSCTAETARVHHSVSAGAQELYMGLVVPSNDANLQHKGMFSQRSEVVYKQCRSICNSTPSAGTEQQRLVLNMHLAHLQDLHMISSLHMKRNKASTSYNRARPGGVLVPADA
jgi:hypothetical protein